MPTDNPTMFATIEKGNQDVIFMYNSPKMGKNTFSWVNSGLEKALDSWCTTYAARHDGGLYIPHVSPGFNDTWKGQSVWGGPSRVWPPIGGPNPATLQRHFDVINKHYSASNPLQYLRFVTMNDWDELTAMELTAGGTPGYFSTA